MQEIRIPKLKFYILDVLKKDILKAKAIILETIACFQSLSYSVPSSETEIPELSMSVPQSYHVSSLGALPVWANSHSFMCLYVPSCAYLP